MPRTPSLSSLFLAWVFFSVAFRTVFQSFLTTYIIDSGYKTPIQNMDELYASGIKLACFKFECQLSEMGEETEVTQVHRNLVYCPMYWDCVLMAIYQQNISILLSDIEAEYIYAVGLSVDENSKQLLCGLEDGVIFPDSRIMLMFPGDPLMRRVNEIIDRVVEAGLYNQWISMSFNVDKILNWNKTIVQQFNGYYSFNLYHLRAAFYLLLMGWCLSSFSFVVEVLYNRILNKIM
jgi:hypothetical protein